MSGPILILVGLLALSALFSSSELAIIGLPLYKIKRYLNENPDSKAGKVLMRLRTKNDRTLIAILVGNNLVNVVLTIFASTVGDGLLQQFAIAGAIGLAIVSVGITFLILFFGEIIPKVFATKYALKFALFVSPIVQGIIYLIFPFVWILEQAIKGINRLLGSVEDKVSRDDVEIFVEEGKKQGIFSSTEALIVHNLLEFHERAVESVYKHRTEVFALPYDCTLEEAVKQIGNESYSRVPLYNGDKDHIVGLITLREAMRLYMDPANRTRSLKSFNLSAIKKIPITASIFEVFFDMKKSGWHFSVVVDEYGGTAGIVTFEDILEDLVGAIKDESDMAEEADIIRLDNHTVKVKGDVILRDIIDVLQIPAWKPPEEHESIDEHDSISYIILDILKEFAKKGDSIQLGALLIEVIKVSKNGDAIRDVKVTVLSADSDEEKTLLSSAYVVNELLTE